MFADDTKVSSKIKSIEDAYEMQRVLDQTYEWANKNKQTFAPNKFQLIRVGKNKIKEDYNY